jgi:hypothetical protein
MAVQRIEQGDQEIGSRKWMTPDLPTSLVRQAKPE